MFNVKCVVAILKFITSRLEANRVREDKKITKRAAKIMKQELKIHGHRKEVDGSARLVKNINKFME